MWNEDQLKGKGKQIKGTVKEKIGKVLDDPALEHEGEIERLKGKIQEGVGKARRQVEETIEKT